VIILYLAQQPTCCRLMLYKPETFIVVFLWAEGQLLSNGYSKYVYCIYGSTTVLTVGPSQPTDWWFNMNRSIVIRHEWNRCRPVLSALHSISFVDSCRRCLDQPKVALPLSFVLRRYCPSPSPPRLKSRISIFALLPVAAAVAAGPARLTISAIQFRVVLAPSL